MGVIGQWGVEKVSVSELIGQSGSMKVRVISEHRSDWTVGEV